MFNFFKSKISKAITTWHSYQELLNLIFEIQRDNFREDNLPTSAHHMVDMLRQMLNEKHGFNIPEERCDSFLFGESQKETNNFFN